MPTRSLESYVIEQTHIDGIVIWQSASGAIFQTILGSKTRKIYESLPKYIEEIG